MTSGQGHGPGTAWVLLYPNDVVTFRDGRPFTAGVAAMGRTTAARPSSVAGAVGALFGPAGRPERLVGPVLVQTGRGRPRVLLPVPADVVVDDEGQATLLRPPVSEDSPVASSVAAWPPGLVSDLDVVPAASGDEGRNGSSGGGTPSSDPGPGGAGGAGPLRLLASDGEPPGGTVASRLIGDYLRGDTEALLDAVAVSAKSAGEPFRLESRLGIARRERTADGEGRTTVPGLLYQEEFWRPAMEAVDGADGQTSGLAFATRVEFDAAVPDPLSAMVRLGGEARQCEARVVPADAAHAPSLPSLPDVSDGRVLLYLMTPAIFPDGWCPRLPPGCELVSACTTGPEVIAGMGGDGRSRPLRWAAGEGSVYFLRFDDPAVAVGFAEEVHGECLPQAEEWMRTAGFGACLVGRW